jgi:tripartite-type tricarboxylate transporter receptor subunit TctC
LTSLAGGFIDMVFSGYETVRPFAETGKVKFFAHTGTEPMGAEQIPPIAEAVEGYEYLNWLTLVAPPGTPKEVTDKLNAALTQIFSEQEVIDQLASQNITGIASTADEAKAYMMQEIADSKAIVESIGLQPE